MIKRIVEEQIIKRMFRGRAILLFGARRTGKTVLVKKIAERFADKNPKYVHCEILSNRAILESRDVERIISYWGKTEMLVLDEAQVVSGIGELLKLLVDLHPEIQIVATGSSAFELANKTKESMVGRVEEFMLYPLSALELVGDGGVSQLENNLERLVVYGSYPEVWNERGDEARRLEHLVSEYLYKDVLMYVGVKNSSLIVDLLQLLSRQIGGEVSYSELAKNLGIDPATTRKYIDILEQNYVIFRLRSYSRNLRKEIAKGMKIYFCDVGVRNALIQAYSPVALRVDRGALWENFLLSERLKYLTYAEANNSRYFWRTHDQQEIDYIEEAGEELMAFEIKWKQPTNYRPPLSFRKTYKQAKISVVTRENYYEWLGF